MNSKTLLSVFFGLFLVASVSCLTVKAASTLGYTDVTVSEAKTMIDSNPSLVVLDVRNQSEYDTGHIRNAKLIPVWELPARLNELNTSDQILTYCKAGGRSATASQTLVDNGFSKVYNMLGGITDWTREQYPIYIKYASIQEAINNATDGDTIYVSTGFYAEHLSINRPVALIGEDKHTTTIDGTANGTVFYVNADNVSISDFTIQYSGCSCAGYAGVSIETNHQNINVTNNALVSDGFGIHVVKAKKVIIAQNNITFATSSCIVVSDSSEISVLKNNITDNFDGIKINSSTENIFSGNAIFSSMTGVSISGSCNNTFIDNTISYNSVTGIFISESCNNTFFANEVSSNSMYGLDIYRSNNNSIFHNSFLANGNQVQNHNSTNFWDTGLEGNFWSNYTGSDADHNGIGDAPLIIDSVNMDNYPLMGVFNSFNTSLSYNVNLVSNSTIDDFEYLESNNTIKLRVSSTTTNQTYGFCRVTIPHNLINPYNSPISVLIDNGQTPVLFLNDTLYDNGTHRWIYFTYSHSTHEILIVPEFPIFLISPMIMIAAVITTATLKRTARKHANGRY